jgi:ribosome-associated toxin RatA of RatAB toxin-antitoxin module
MPRVTATIEIEGSAEDAFAVVADPNRRRRLLPDNFRDFRIVSESEQGPGTRMSFRIVTPQGEYPSEIEITAWEPPHTLTEQAVSESPYTMHWTFEPAGPGARVEVQMDYPAQGSIIHRAVERWFARRPLQQSLLVELLRLKDEVEGN